jgi:hypothetical protein
MKFTLPFVSHVTLIVAAGLGSPGVALSQNWPDQMFGDRQHDFGVVARGSKAEHSFRFENTSTEPVHVHSVQSSCNCTVPVVAKDWIQPGETSEVLCRYNTQSFVGQRSAEVTVRFDKPSWGEAKLRITGVIRGDIFVEPGMIEFGQVEQASSPSKTIRVSHQGNSNWRIADVKSSCPYIKVQLKELFRGQGVVNYELIAQLAENAEPGYLQNELILFVSQPQGRNRSSEVRFPIPFTANVTPTLEISPTTVEFGPLKSGDSTSTKVVIKSRAAFKITDVVCDDDNFSCKVTESAGGRLQLLELSYEANQGSNGEIKNTIRILTDLKDKPQINIPVVVTIGE